MRALGLVGWIGLGLIGLTGVPGAAFAACQINMIAEFPVVMDGNSPLIDAKLDGRSVRFLIDTGSFATLIARPAAASLGLNAHLVGGARFYGVGGSDVVDKATIHEFKLGAAVAHDLPILVTGPGLKSGRYVGILGEDVLSHYDVEFDLANGVMRLMRPSDCPGDKVVYWGKAYSIAPIAPSNNGTDLQVYVTLNGQKMLAELDSGAYTSVVTTSAARAAGVTPQSQGVQESGLAGGIGAKSVQTYTGTFSSFTVGDETIKNAKLKIADLFGEDTEVETGSLIVHKMIIYKQMLLGADFIRAHRMYIARSQGKIYFSYNGGPVFQVRGPSADQAPAPGIPPQPPKP